MTPLALRVIDGECLGSPAAGVQAIDFPRFGLVVEHEEIATDPIDVGLDDAHDSIGRDGGVDGVAALLRGCEHRPGMPETAGLRQCRTSKPPSSGLVREPRRTAGPAQSAEGRNNAARHAKRVISPLDRNADKCVRGILPSTATYRNSAGVNTPFDSSNLRMTDRKRRAISPAPSNTQTVTGRPFYLTMPVVPGTLWNGTALSVLETS